MRTSRARPRLQGGARVNCRQVYMCKDTKTKRMKEWDRKKRDWKNAGKRKKLSDKDWEKRKRRAEAKQDAKRGGNVIFRGKRPLGERLNWIKKHVPAKGPNADAKIALFNLIYKKHEGDHKAAAPPAPPPAPAAPPPAANVGAPGGEQQVHHPPVRRKLGPRGQPPMKPVDGSGRWGWRRKWKR